MKTLRILLLTLALTALNAFAADPVTATVTNIETTVTNETAKTNKAHEKSVDFSVDFGSGSLPKDVLDKLSPDQIVELEKAKRSHVALDDILVPLAFFSCVVLVVAVTMSFRHKRQQLVHQTLRTMIEKGVAIPPELLQPASRRRPRNDVRTGLILLSIGLAFLVVELGEHERPGLPALIPAMMGIAFLVVSRFDKHKDKDGQP